VAPSADSPLMRRASPSLRCTPRGIRARRHGGFAILAAVCFLLGFSLGEAGVAGIRPMDREARGRIAAALPSLSSEGPLEITAFVDYSNPVALRTHRTLERVRRAYGERVRARVRLLPERVSASAWLAHSVLAAAEAEGLPRVEWERRVADLAAHSRPLPCVGQWLACWAAELQIGPQALRRSLSAPATARILARDRAIARAHGIRRAPAMIVAGRILEGPVPYEVLREQIDDRLEARAPLSI